MLKDNSLLKVAALSFEHNLRMGPETDECFSHCVLRKIFEWCYRQGSWCLSYHVLHIVIHGLQLEEIKYLENEDNEVVEILQQPFLTLSGGTARHI